jgi:hypothetical protein
VNDVYVFMSRKMARNFCRDYCQQPTVLFGTPLKSAGINSGRCPRRFQLRIVFDCLPTSGLVLPLESGL